MTPLPPDVAGAVEAYAGYLNAPRVLLAFAGLRRVARRALARA